MGTGGARFGAGRKKKAIETRRVAGADGVVESPADLTPQAAQIWADLAPLARQAETLTPHTASAFRLLCDLSARYRETAAALEASGLTIEKVTVDGSGQEHREPKAHPLLAVEGRLAKQIELLSARFCLAPMGRPIKAEPRPSADQRERFFTKTA